MGHNIHPAAVSVSQDSECDLVVSLISSFELVNIKKCKKLGSSPRPTADQHSGSLLSGQPITVSLFAHGWLWGSCLLIRDPWMSSCWVHVVLRLNSSDTAVVSLCGFSFILFHLLKLLTQRIGARKHELSLLCQIWCLEKQIKFQVKKIRKKFNFIFSLLWLCGIVLEKKHRLKSWVRDSCVVCDNFKMHAVVSPGMKKKINSSAQHLSPPFLSWKHQGAPCVTRSPLRSFFAGLYLDCSMEIL